MLKVALDGAGRRGRVVRASDCRAGGRRFKSWHPSSAETCMWGRRLAAMHWMELLLEIPPTNLNSDFQTVAIQIYSILRLI